MPSWPQDPDAYVSAAQVAEKLGYRSIKTFYNARRGELARKGFPNPCRGRLWRASQILRWETWNADMASAGQVIANDHTPAPPVAKPAPNALPSPAEQRLAQIRRAAGLAS